MKIALGIRSEQGMSKVLGVVLLVAIVLLLTVTAGSMALHFADQQPEEPSLQALSFEETRYNVEVTAHSSLANTDQLEIKVNGETRRIWKDYSAGTSKSIQCVGPGDTISVVSTGSDNSYTINEHEVSRKTDCRFEVSVGSSTTKRAVSPIGWQRNSEEFDEFYSYAHAHAHMDPSSDVIAPDTSYMFFYEYRDKVALVVVHDLPQKHGPSIDGSEDHSGSNVPSVQSQDYTYSGSSDTGGGAVDMTFQGLPSSGSWVLEDDSGDYTYSHVDTGEQCTAVANRVCWSWASKNTDGGIYAGGFEDSENVDVKVVADWNDPSVDHDTIGDGHVYDNADGDTGQITDWKFLYATDDGIEAIDLDKDKPVHIEGLSRSP